MARGTGEDLRPEEHVPSPDPNDASFDEFERLGMIGSGGNADVTKESYDGPGPDVVAIKQPRMQGTMSVDSVQQFTDEAETWEKLDDHDNIVGVLNYESDPFPWIALEYMDGGSLTERLDDLNVSEALWVSLCVARAVRHAHRRGIAHLDLKPDNVLFATTEGEQWDTPKVADWGLAKMLLEHSKSIEGLSPEYAAPEQFDEETYGRADDLTDVYAIGALTYAALVGEPPFTGTSTAVMQSVLSEDPPAPSERVDGLPPGTDSVVTQALATEKDDRYESVLDLRRDLETLLERSLGNPDAGALIASGGTSAVGAGSTASLDADQRESESVGAGSRPERNRGDRQKPTAATGETSGSQSEVTTASTAGSSGASAPTRTDERDAESGGSDSGESSTAQASDRSGSASRIDPGAAGEGSSAEQANKASTTSDKEPGLAAFLSFITGGWGGQVYNGQLGKAVGLVIAQVVNFLLMAVFIGFLTALATWAYGVYDAYTGAQAINEGETASSSEESSGSTADAEPDGWGNWHYLTLAPFPASFLGFLISIVTFSSESLTGFMFLGMLVGGVALWKDMSYIEATGCGWSPSKIGYIAGMLIWYVTIPVYLYQRHTNYGL